MAANKDIIDSYRCINSMDYIINDIDIDDIYRPMLTSVNKCIKDFIDNNKSLDINSSNGFTYLLKYIYNKALCKYMPFNNNIPNNKMITANIDNIYLLDTIFNIYIAICYKCNIKPTILRYSILTNIAMDTIHHWKNNKLKNSNAFIACSTVKSWYSICESALYDEATTTGNIGCIFALKANYGYRDNIVVNVTEDPQDTKGIEDIEKDYIGLENNTDNTIDF